MTEEVKEKAVFRLPAEELANPKYRKGYPGRLYVNYPNTENWRKDMIVPHPNYKVNLAAYYKSGGYNSIRGDMLNDLKRKR